MSDNDNDFLTTTDEDDYLDVDDSGTLDGSDVINVGNNEEIVAGDDDASLLALSEAIEEHMNPEGFVAQLIDIREPLTNLRRALERRMKVDLRGFNFWLQDSQMLPETTTLVEQCIQGEGLVQINVEIKLEEGGRVKKMNIIDVLQPQDDVLEQAGRSPSPRFRSPTRSAQEEPFSPPPVEPEPERTTASSDAQAQDKTTSWVACAAFRKEQDRLKIPKDPIKWERPHVAHWIKWAAKEFPQASIDLRDWYIDGKEMCAMTETDFREKVPIDPSDLMWTHFVLLQQCKFVAVIQKGKTPGAGTAAHSTSAASSVSSVARSPTKMLGSPPLSLPRKTAKKPPVRLGQAKFTVMSESALGNRTGNNGQVQLWQFLLELLTEKEHREVIHWIGEEGEFKLENPEQVAQLWGSRKNKPNMNYEKLSRALRYYYDGDMISKVHGKRFVYKFVCDLKKVVGYTAAELNQKVQEAEQKALGRQVLFR